MGDYGIYDPSTGQRAAASTSPAAGPARSQADYEWTPGNVQTDDPHDAGYVDASDLADSKVDGPLPSNIVSGELEHSLRAADDDWEGGDPCDVPFRLSLTNGGRVSAGRWL
jgi:hypothetical protein